MLIFLIYSVMSICFPDNLDDILINLDTFKFDETALNSSPRLETPFEPPLLFAEDHMPSFSLEPAYQSQQAYAVTASSNGPDFNTSAHDEQDLLNCCSPEVATGQSATVARNTGSKEEILYEFELKENGELVSNSNTSNTYDLHQTTQFQEVLTDDKNLSTASVPTDRASSPLTVQWNDVGEEKLSSMLSVLVTQTPEHCKYSERNELHHIKSQGKFSFNALLKG